MRKSLLIVLIMFIISTLNSVANSHEVEADPEIPAAGIAKAISQVDDWEKVDACLEREESKNFQLAGIARVLKTSADSFVETEETEVEVEAEVETEIEAETEVETEVEVASETEIKGFPQYSNESFLLAQIIYYEVGNCSRLDKIITGSVVINRARTEYRTFRNVHTFREVLYQNDCGQQYAWSTINKIEGFYCLSDEEQSIVLQEMAESIEVANGLISGEIECWPEYVLDQSEFSAETIRAWGYEKLDIEGVEETYGTPVDF